MKLKGVVAILTAVFVIVGLVPAGAQYYGGAPSAAYAQDGKVEKEKGVSAKNLYTSLGPNWRGSGNVPIALSGQVLEIAPGGQTGRQRHLVPSYIYVLEGALVTNSFGGPVGVNGVQYHAAGQSYMDAVGVWHNHSNSTQAPVKYLLLLISTPGASTTEKAKDED